MFTPMDPSHTSGNAEMSIVATLERFEETFAILKSPDIGEICWPIRNLPPDVKLGERVTLKVITERMKNDEQFERMRKLLQELIN